MKKDIIILGSTGSIGITALSAIKKNKSLFNIILLSSNKNILKLLKQAKKFNVKNLIIEDENIFNKYKEKLKLKKINLYLGHKSIKYVIKHKVNYVINSISGINGLEPTLKIIPLTKNILIANKEAIICGWDLIKKKLYKNKTNFIPLDSEHFSIWSLIKNSDKNNIEKIILTASGGPFLSKKFNNLKNIKPKQALNHPIWSMGKKISIDSSTMMNKIFEFIEAKKIFNLKNNSIAITIHPASYIHAIVFFKGGIIKLLAHEANMLIPISNALNINNNISKKKNFYKQIEEFNKLKFIKPDHKKFPLLKLLDIIPNNSSYFETILITINDYLVYKYLDNKINYHSIHYNLLNLINNSFFKKYYKLKPKSINDIKDMIKITNQYLDNNV